MGNTTRRFVFDGKDCYFSKETFKIHFHAYQTAKKLNANETKRLLAQHLDVSEASVHGWLYGRSGPSDTNLISGIADFFGSPESDFYVEEEQIAMERLNEQQIKSVDRIYKEIINFLFVFLNTDGIFTGSSVIYGLDIPFDRRLEYADSEFEKVRIAWYKEFVYLKGTKIYDELDEYIENDLIGAYQDISDNIPGVDKCSPGYRYEPGEGKAASDDFNEAIIKIQKLVCKYI